MNPPLWFANLLAYCLQLTALVLAGAALAAVFRLRAPRVLLAYWQGLLAACLLLPLLQPWQAIPVPTAAPGGSVSISFRVAAGSEVEGHTSLFPLILGVLLAGMLLRLGWLALGLRKLQAIRRTAQALDPLPAWIPELGSRLGVSPAWFCAPEVEGPATFGIHPPSVLLPQRFFALSPPFQRAIAGHEMLHVARRDWIHNMAEELVLTIYWFHPAVAWVVNRIRLSREQVVDEEVVRLISARQPYVRALLEIATGGTGPAWGAAPTFLKERQLASRIELLVKEVTMSKLRIVLSVSAMTGLLILAGGASIWAFPLRAPAPAPVPAAEAPAPAADSDLKLVSRVNPVYPAEAKKAGIQGIVVLRATIAKDGTVSDLKVVSGDPQLADSALNAVRQWRYAPLEKSVITDVRVNYTLADGGGTPPAPTVAKEGEEATEGTIQPIKQIQPTYPQLAKAGGIQGIVVLRATIEKDGSVSNLEVVRGHPLLVKAAIDAVRQWRYPADNAGTTDVTLNFTLEKDSAPAANSQPLETGETRPIPIFKPDPPYTKEAKAAKLQGTVVLRIGIGADGTVSDAKVVKSLDPGLDASAVKTVMTWKFHPATKDGKPVPVKSTIEINFKFY